MQEHGETTCTMHVGRSQSQSVALSRDARYTGYECGYRSCISGAVVLQQSSLDERVRTIQFLWAKVGPAGSSRATSWFGDGVGWDDESPCRKPPRCLAIS